MDKAEQRASIKFRHYRRGTSAVVVAGCSLLLFLSCSLASAFSPQHILSRLAPQQTLGIISRIDLQSVSLQLNRDEQFFLSLSADRAQVKLGSPKVKLRGHVMLHSHTGERLSAEEMRWDQQNKVLEVEGAYVLAGPHAEQRGSNASFIVDRNGALKRYFRTPRIALGETS